MKLDILVGCEESQAVTMELRNLGVNAYSCDILNASGNLPQYHIKDDILKVINLHNWTCLIAFPPCTFLTDAGNGYFNINKYGAKAEQRIIERQKAVEFFKQLYFCNIKHIALENPKGYLNNNFKKPDQTIHPYYFGDKNLKRTCLWLKNLPKLQHFKTNDLFNKQTHVNKPAPKYKQANGKNLYFTESISSKKHSYLRSKTFNVIAKEMAIQWTEYLQYTYNL